MTNVNVRAAIDYAKELFFEKGTRWSSVEKDLRALYPELSDEEIIEVKGTLSYLIEQFGIQISSSLRVNAYEGSAGTDWATDVEQPKEEKELEKKKTLDALYENDATVQQILNKLTDRLVDELSNVITVDPSELADSEKYTLQEMTRINENLDAWKGLDTAERSELRTAIERYVYDMYDKNFKGSVGGPQWTALTGEDQTTATLNVYLIDLIDDGTILEDDARLLHRTYDSVHTLKQDMRKHNDDIQSLIESIKKEEKHEDRPSAVHAPEQLKKFIADMSSKYKITVADLTAILHDDSLYGSSAAVLSDRVLINPDLVSAEWFSTMEDIIKKYTSDGDLSDENKKLLLLELHNAAPLS